MGGSEKKKRREKRRKKNNREKIEKVVRDIVFVPIISFFFLINIMFKGKMVYLIYLIFIKIFNSDKKQKKIQIYF